MIVKFCGVKVAIIHDCSNFLSCFNKEFHLFEVRFSELFTNLCGTQTKNIHIMAESTTPSLVFGIAIEQLDKKLKDWTEKINNFVNNGGKGFKLRIDFGEAESVIKQLKKLKIGDTSEIEKMQKEIDGLKKKLRELNDGAAIKTAVDNITKPLHRGADESKKVADDIEKTFGYPVIIKPVNLGSSVGIGVAKSRDELIDAIDDAFRYAARVMAEHAISKLREINCSVLGDENEALASECEEPLTSGEILSYEDKYVNSGGKKGGSKGGSGSKGAGMANLSRKIPAELSPEKREEIRELAVKSFKALGCCGVSRIDFMIDEEEDKLYFNEINPIPGSLSFYLWEPVGVPYKELLDRMIQLALKRTRIEESLTFTFDTNILKTADLG